MLKRFYFTDGSGDYVVVGIANDIRHLYKRMIERIEITNVYPTFCNFPKFNNNLFYGIIVENNMFSIVSQTVVIDWLMNDLIK